MAMDKVPSLKFTARIDRKIIKELKRLLKTGDPRALTLALKSSPYPIVYRYWKEKGAKEDKLKLVSKLAKTIHKQLGGTNWQWKNQIGAGVPIAMKLSKIVLSRLSRLGALVNP